MAPPKMANTVSVVCIFDTHNRFPDIPSGDLLVHAGDLSQGGTHQEIQCTLDWLKDQPHQFKVVIAGNHELLLDPQKGLSNTERTSLNWHDIIYLQDCGKSLCFKSGRVPNLYGSPSTQKHGNWACGYPRGVENGRRPYQRQQTYLLLICRLLVISTWMGLVTSIYWVRCN